MQNTENSNEVLFAKLSDNVVESYIWATSRQGLSIYSERLLMQLVKTAQCQLHGIDYFEPVKIDPKTMDAIVQINVKDLMNSDDDKNYTYVKNAVRELMSSFHESEEPLYKNGQPVLTANGKQVYHYQAHSILNDVDINSSPGLIVVEVNKKTWSAILDYSKGYRYYDLKIAMKLSGVYALRLYKLISEQESPICYTIEQLRELWHVEDKYKKTKDFLKVFEKAKQELDEKSPWTFSYEPVCAASDEDNKGRRGRKRITSIRITPVKQIQYAATTETLKQLSPVVTLGKDVVDYLVHNYTFEMTEIKSNRVLFEICGKFFGSDGKYGRGGPDLLEFLEEIRPSLSKSRAANPQGYVINALKNHLEGLGIIIKKGGEVVASDNYTPQIM